MPLPVCASLSQVAVVGGTLGELAPAFVVAVVALGALSWTFP